MAENKDHHLQWVKDLAKRVIEKDSTAQAAMEASVPRRDIVKEQLPKLISNLLNELQQAVSTFNEHFKNPKLAVSQTAPDTIQIKTIPNVLMVTVVGDPENEVIRTEPRYNDGGQGFQFGRHGSILPDKIWFHIMVDGNEVSASRGTISGKKMDIAEVAEAVLRPMIEATLNGKD